jgi:hypothetical protein
MHDVLQYLQQIPPINEQQIYILLAILAGLLILFFLLRPPLHRWWQERQISRAINRMGARIMHDVHLPDGLGGEVVIENLLLAKDAILVVDVKRFEGLIFGSSHTDKWTQVINKCSFKFPNPGRYLQLQIDAVRAVVPKVPVRGLHLFTHNAVFPRDKPPTVLLLHDLDTKTSTAKLKDVPEGLHVAWKQLVDTVS